MASKHGIKKDNLLLPRVFESEATAPLGILAVATPLLRAGYQSGSSIPRSRRIFSSGCIEELADALCLAVSLVTGPMIRETVQIARAAKAAVSGSCR